MPGLGRSFGEGKGYPLQNSGLEIPWIVDLGVTKSQTWLSDFHFYFRLVIDFLPRSKRLLISWLQSSSAVILEPPKYSLILFSHVFALKWWDQMPWALFLNVEFKANIFTLLFHFHQEALCFSSLSTVRVVSFSYLRLLNHTNVIVPFETFKCA